MKEFITRKINREYNEILLKGAEVGSTGDFNVSAENADKANDYLVKAMTWKTQEEIDEMSQKDFEDILIKINKIKSTPWQSNDTKD